MYPRYPLQDILSARPFKTSQLNDPKTDISSVRPTKTVTTPFQSRSLIYALVDDWKPNSVMESIHGGPPSSCELTLVDIPFARHLCLDYFFSATYIQASLITSDGYGHRRYVHHRHHHQESQRYVEYSLQYHRRRNRHHRRLIWLSQIVVSQLHRSRACSYQPRYSE